MQEVTTDAVQAMADATGIPLMEDDAVEVAHRVNAFFVALAPLSTLALDRVPPVLVDPADR